MSMVAVGENIEPLTEMKIIRFAQHKCKSWGSVSVEDIMSQVVRYEPITVMVSQVVDCLIRNGYKALSPTSLEFRFEGIVGKKPDKKKEKPLEKVIIDQDKKLQILSAISQVELNDLIFVQWGFGEVFEKGIAVTMLFWGVPGTGKTLTAQAIAEDIGYELKIYSTAEIESSEPGGAERMIKAIFAENKKKKSIILFDECDSLLMDRNEVGPILGAQVNALLMEIERHDGVVIFTTNRLGKLDAALERRITAKIEFEFPDKEKREAIWKRLIPKKAPISKNVDWGVLAEYPIAGGNIKNSVLNAAREAAFTGSKTIKKEHFVKAVEREMQGVDAFTKEYQRNEHSYRDSGTMKAGSGVLSVTKQKIMAKIAKKDKEVDKVEDQNAKNG